MVLIEVPAPAAEEAGAPGEGLRASVDRDAEGLSVEVDVDLERESGEGEGGVRTPSPIPFSETLVFFARDSTLSSPSLGSAFPNLDFSLLLPFVPAAVPLVVLEVGAGVAGGASTISTFSSMSALRTHLLLRVYLPIPLLDPIFSQELSPYRHPLLSVSSSTSPSAKDERRRCSLKGEEGEVGRESSLGLSEEAAEASEARLVKDENKVGAPLGEAGRAPEGPFGEPAAEAVGVASPVPSPRTILPPSPTTTRHSSSSQLHLTVRFSHLPPSVCRVVTLSAGSVKLAGGLTGPRLESVHEARS
jgi:hypothetical protein